jgi:hypothetical protein
LSATARKDLRRKKVSAYYSQFRLRSAALEELPLPRGEIVEARHRAARGNEGVDHGAADEPRAASDETFQPFAPALNLYQRKPRIKVRLRRPAPHPLPEPGPVTGSDAGVRHRFSLRSER